MLTPTLIHQQLQTSHLLPTVWQWIGTADGLSGWLNGTVSFDAVEGGRFEERGDYRRGPYVLRGRVLKILPPLMLVVTYRLDTPGDGQWPIYTPVEMTLRRDGEVTTLDVKHKGFENLPEAYRDSAFSDFQAGWQSAFDRLRGLLEA